jgi:hypothetical protein
MEPGYIYGWKMAQRVIWTLEKNEVLQFFRDGDG